MEGRWKPRHALLLFAIAAFGIAIIVIIYQTIAQSENDEARTAFAATLGLEIERFQDFFRLRLLGMRAVADSLSAQSLPISRATIELVSVLSSLP